MPSLGLPSTALLAAGKLAPKISRTRNKYCHHHQLGIFSNTPKANHHHQHRYSTTMKSNPDVNKFQQLLNSDSTDVNKFHQLLNSDSTGGWEKCWEEGCTPWDLGQPTPIILHLHQIGALPKGRALIPGCGSGHDVEAIACPERYVVGLDISDSAIKTATEISDHVGGPPYKVSVDDYEEALQPMGFKAISIVENEFAIGPRKGREKLGRWKRSIGQSML